MPQQYLHIELSNDYTLDFKIHNTPLADLWLERMSLRHQYPIDHPDRFYGLNSSAEEKARAERMIQGCIDTINSYQPIITRQFTDVYDQDFLNYLHSIFEQYHGLLNQQKTIWWFKAPTAVKKALAELNLAVHRCESLSRGEDETRFVCTWYGLPNTCTLSEEIMKEYGINNPPFGSVVLNYVEIGKTLYDLSLDNDEYISDDAFRPFKHYTPDFAVRLSTATEERVAETIEKMKAYYQKHYEFFSSRGLTQFDDVRLLPLFFPVAQLIETIPREQLLKEIQQRQLVTRVYIDETMHHTTT